MLKLRYVGRLMWSANSLEKPLMLGKVEVQRGRGQRMRWWVWHHQLNGHESEQTLGDGEGQGSLVCCRSWGCKELDMIERLNSSNSFPLVEMPRYSPNSGLRRHQRRLEIFFRKYPRVYPKAGLWRLRKTEFSRWSQSLIPFLYPFPCYLYSVIATMLGQFPGEIYDCQTFSVKGDKKVLLPFQLVS